MTRTNQKKRGESLNVRGGQVDSWLSRSITQTRAALEECPTEVERALEVSRQAIVDFDQSRTELQPTLDALQQEGDLLASEMRRCFAAANEAWNADDRASAKAWAVKGHDFERRCRETNVRAQEIRDELKNAAQLGRDLRLEAQEQQMECIRLKGLLQIAEANVIDYSNYDLQADEPSSWEPLSDAWAASYRAVVESESNLWEVPLDNGFTYLFDDLSGKVDGEAGPNEVRNARVVAAWGATSTPKGKRDKARMRGFPPPLRKGDQKGHLVAMASGGGYDINLVPMDAGLNLGRTSEGKRFRAMESYCARHPGTPFFIRPIYEDNADRPSAFEGGVKLPTGIWVDSFANG